MTETTLTEPPPEAAPGAGIPIHHPSDILTNLVVAFLVPMFLGASGGDIHFARMAAIETVKAYRARDHAYLIAIMQIVACGLTALGSLSLSMEDNISLSMTLRLRGNAVALSRAAEQNRRALRVNGHDNAMPYQAERTDTAQTPSEADARYEAKVVAGVAAARQRAAEIQASLKDQEPAARPAPILVPSAIAVPAAAPLMLTEQQRQAMWAGAMADVAGEYTASLPHLPPAG